MAAAVSTFENMATAIQDTYTSTYQGIYWQNER